MTSSHEHDRPRLFSLDDERALDAAATGGKAAALARARQAGLPVGPGAVLTTGFTSEVAEFGDLEGHPTIREVFDQLHGADKPLVARSSSTVEDLEQSSMAGQFDSVLAIDGLDELTAAVNKVIRSGHAAGEEDSPIAVLCQPFIEATWGGVLFGIDPVTGRSDRMVVTAVEGGPGPLVSGQADGSRIVVTHDGAVASRDLSGGPDLPPGLIGRLVELGHDVAELFDAPQDVEWAVDGDGELRLLQSRPVTTEIRGVPEGPLYGPGPVAETFPEALSPLEADLWVPPLRAAVREAMQLSGAASSEEVQRSDVVVVIDGRVAIDLELTGQVERSRPWWSRLNPAARVRRLRSAWQVGRLRGALPDLAQDLLDRTDADLESVPPPESLTSRQLLALLQRGQEVLTALHAHEILMGVLTDMGRPQLTGASVALRVLGEGRLEKLTDQEIMELSPVVLALTPPKVAPASQLPPHTETPDLATMSTGANDEGVIREALRLRVRWLQELTGRAAWVLGQRLVGLGHLERAEQVRYLPLDDLSMIVTKRARPHRSLIDGFEPPSDARLPARFRISDRGRPIPDEGHGAETGTGAGGGTGRGPVTHDTDDPPAGAVLVTSTLSPGLGPLLSRLGGIVSETGSVLSHLAILAREAGVPVVVGYSGAVDELPEGATVTVDGTSGAVVLVSTEDDEPEEDRS